MVKQPLNGVLQHLRKLAAVQTSRELPDHELLERFVSARDEGAFTVLIERHGPMVLGVCRRSLPNVQDAEDACQATFLVLARKAGSIRNKTSLSNWLHGVACRVVANLKRDHARRKTRERTVEAPSPRDPAAEVSWREVQAILDDELQRLPLRYRAPMILCYLEGLTRDEAARQLGLSGTTLHGRLERARDLLRACLRKRGLTMGAALSAAVLGESVAQAALAPTFVVSSTTAAMLLAAEQPLTEGVVATQVLSLTQEVLKTMFLTKLKLGTAAVLCAALCVALVGGIFDSLGLAQNANGPHDNHVVGSPKTEHDDMKPPKSKQNEVILQGTSKAFRGAGQEFRIEALAFSEDGKTLAFMGTWDTTSGKERDPSQKTENDLDFIGRISKELRGVNPTPTEIHFFVASNDPGRRQKLIDLFIQERQAAKTARDLAERIDSIIQKRWSDEEKRLADGAISDAEFLRRSWLDLTGKLPSPADVERFLANKDPNKRAKLIDQLLEREDFTKLWADYFGIKVDSQQTKTGLGALQKKFYTELLAAKNKSDVSTITQTYLDRMIDYVMANPKSQDVADAMRQIIFVYESRGKTVEAGAWREKLLQEHLKTSADLGQELRKNAERLARLPAELVATKRTDSEIVDTLFMATLARLPAEAEKGFAVKQLKASKDREKICRDLLWVLVNTKEFMELHSMRAGSEVMQFHDVLTKTWK